MQNLTLPKGLTFLKDKPKTRLLEEAFKLYGIRETSGNANNPEILSWAKDCGLAAYKEDSIPWCGLFMAYISKQAGKPELENPLWALNWAAWGNPSLVPRYGDILVFKRKTAEGKIAGHVGLYLAESKNFLYVLGGNTNDKVGIAKIAKSRLIAARNSYKVFPACVGQVFVKDEEVNLNISKNEV